MRPVDRTEIMPIGEYETIRDRFRARVIEEKKRRRFRVADRASVVFENPIGHMPRADRKIDAVIDHVGRFPSGFESR